MSEPDSCICCAAAATRLCDFVLGFSLYATVPYLMTDGKTMYTCDAPLCEAHTRTLGTLFCCGKDGEHEPIDRCPQHADDDSDYLPITEADADYLRRGVHAKLRRGTIRHVPD